MTVRASIQIHFDRGDVSHRHRPSYSVLDFGYTSGTSVSVHFTAPEEIDEVIAELTALRAEMTAPVITDSERTCDQANPASGAWCHKKGAHKTHRDTNGETWTTAGLTVAAKAAS